MDQEELDRILENHKKRMEEKGKKEEEEDEHTAEKQRQAYLRRTGRTEMKP